MCNFIKDDVVKIAKAITDDPLRRMDGDFTPYYFCEFCEAELKGWSVNEKDFKHDTDCPVLVAQDILTGI